MKVKLLIIGKTKIGFVEEGIKHYAKRIPHYVPFEIQTLVDTKAKNAVQQKKEEGILVLKHVQPNDFLVLLDEKGKSFNSREFAEFLQQQFNTSVSIIFAIGGAHGFSAQVYNRANAKVALSKMTMPHDLVRVVFLEQMYRALTILKGEPYHHD